MSALPRFILIKTFAVETVILTGLAAISKVAADG